MTVISCHEEKPEVEASLSIEAEAKKPQKRKGVTKYIGGNKMNVVCPECSHEHEITTEAEKIQAELDEALAKLEAQESKLTELETSNAELQGDLEAELIATQRFTQLVAKVGTETATEALPSLRKIDDETFNIMVSMATVELTVEEPEEEPESPPEQPPTIVASDEDPPVEEDFEWNYVG